MQINRFQKMPAGMINNMAIDSPDFIKWLSTLQSRGEEARG